jgi:ketol-acid reductoisomerase
MGTNIGRVDDEQLEKNVQKIVAAIRAGSTTWEVVASNRTRELTNLIKMRSTEGNRKRISYVLRELARLQEVLDAQNYTDYE